MQPDDARMPAVPQVSSAQEPPGNPFATRYVRPGAVPYFFPPGASYATLVGRLEGFGWRGEIVGPHGSGKSTLLAGLIEAIEAGGRRTVVYRLHEGERRLPREPRDLHSLRANEVVVVDGFEQLPCWRKWLLRGLCQRRGLGLVATTHAPTGLPLLWQASVDRATVERVVGFLLAGEPAAAALISQDDIAEALAKHPDNAREALFVLYDVVERRRGRAE
jgi:hypothetical protein